MTDLTKLTAKEFRDTQSRFLATTVWDELWRRAERLERCEAALTRAWVVLDNYVIDAGETTDAARAAVEG